MTDLRQAAQQALEALTIYSDAQCSLKGQAAITALRTALEQQAEPVQEQKYEKRIAPYSTTLSMLLNTAPPQQQAEPPPEWPLIKNILDEYGLDAISFVAEWKAAQRPWVGLTDEDWEWVADKKETSLDTFAHGAAWAADQLKERNT